MIMNLEVSANNWFDQARQAGLEAGKKEGIKEGKHLGLLEAARALIEKGMTIEEVSELLELPPVAREKLEKEIDG
jgi:predicted transposase/invertase (TIGR01784 family)